MGGWHSEREASLRLWIESAHQSQIREGVAVCDDAISTFQTEKQFFAILVSGGWQVEGGAVSVAEKAASMLKQGILLKQVVDALLSALPKDKHIPFSLLEILGGNQASVVECDAPPLFMTRQGQLLSLPVLEEVSHGHLVRECQFTVKDGDHIAMVSEGYIRARGRIRPWGWRDIADSIRRLTGTRCDAEQLLGALMRSYERLAQGGRGVRGEERGVKSLTSQKGVSVVAMFVRPIRTATVWSGPPVKRAAEKQVLDNLMSEPGARILCGDTTAEIAARLLGAELMMEPPPEDGWAEVPPVSKLEGVSLVTEGVVTMGKARERMAGAQRIRDLRQEDGATRLARLLLTADKIHFLVGLAINPAQVADKAGKVPLRRIVIEDLMTDLKARGKIVSVEYF
jgi:hypothetical protein